MRLPNIFETRNKILCTILPADGCEPYQELLTFYKQSEYEKVIPTTYGCRIIKCETGYVERKNGEVYFLDTGVSTVYIENKPEPIK